MIRAREMYGSIGEKTHPIQNNLVQDAASFFIYLFLKFSFKNLKIKSKCLYGAV
jgi:hypothetical protein